MCACDIHVQWKRGHGVSDEVGQQNVPTRTFKRDPVLCKGTASPRVSQGIGEIDYWQYPFPAAPLTSLPTPFSLHAPYLVQCFYHFSLSPYHVKPTWTCPFWVSHISGAWLQICYNQRWYFKYLTTNLHDASWNAEVRFWGPLQCETWTLSFLDCREAHGIPRELSHSCNGRVTSQMEAHWLSQNR